MPTLSVVIVAHESSAALARTLPALVGELRDGDELIVVDNGSSDDSLGLARTADAPFPIAILANHHNESFSDACNQGAALASGSAC